VVIVLGLHLIALNVLYPKFLGNRLQLNPLAVTIALLVWGWLLGSNRLGIGNSNYRSHEDCVRSH